MEENSYAVCTSIYQRSYLLDEKEIENNDEIAKKWFANSLLNENKLRLSVVSRGMSREKYINALRELSEDDMRCLQRKVEGEKWYRAHNSILSYITEEDLTNTSELCFFTHPYREWGMEHLKKVSQEIGIGLSEKALKKSAEEINRECMSISIKTLVYDQNKLIQNGFIDGDNLLFKYLDYRFSSEKTYKLFYEQYPVLSRLLAERVMYFVDNIIFFLATLKSNKKQIKERWKLKNISQVENIDFAKGDSHDQGKAVLFFIINNTRLVFKYKNLDISNRLQLFWEKLEWENPEYFSFYKSERIVGRNYTIETFVPRTSCDKDSDIQKYYYRFGQLIFLIYILGGTDLHYGNIIAVKDYPVIVDSETLFHNEKMMTRSEDALYNYFKRANESIVSTGMIPNSFGTDKTINMSALSGGAQPLPEKVEKLMYKSTGRMFFSLEKEYIFDADNLPLLENKPVCYDAYCNNILEGFEQAAGFVLQNKEKLLCIMEEVFKGAVVRTIMRNTQKYDSMLQFALHPSCMVDYIKREKIFENLWDYPFKKPIIVRYEIEELLKNDVPIFFNNINSTSIICSGGKIIKNFFEISAWKRVKERVISLSYSEYVSQENLLLLALKCYKGDKIKYTVDGRRWQIIYIITDKLIKSPIWGKDKQSIVWDTLVCNEKKQWHKQIMGLNYYNGMTGIYIYLLAQKNFLADSKHRELENAIKNTIFKSNCLNVPLQTYEQYIDYFSVLYLCIWRYKQNADFQDLYIAYSLFCNIKDYYFESEMKDDWLFGRAGLLKICTNLYLLKREDEILEFINVLINDLKIQNIDCGFAHGYAGIIYSLLYVFDNIKGLYNIFKNKLILLIEEFHNKVENMSLSNGAWCNGVGGAYFTILCIESSMLLHEITKKFLWDKEKMLTYLLNLQLEDDCLCHGSMGMADIFIKIIDMSLLEKENQERVNEKLENIFAENDNVFKIRGLRREPGYGLMDGISGIAYTYLRFHDNKDLPSILFLDI